MTIGSSNLRHAALIVAAGRGSRMDVSGDVPAKQYQLLGQRTVLEHSLETCLSHPLVATVQVVIHPEDHDVYAETLRAVPDPNGKLRKPIDGGATRQISTLNGLQALAAMDVPDTVLIHDAARPFLAHAMIDALLSNVKPDSGALPALLVVDTLKRGTVENRVESTVSRDGLWRAQTPQAFPFEAIVAAHMHAAESGRVDFTDDASIAEAAGLPVALVPGDEALRKITTKDDLFWARAHLNQKGDMAMSTLETRVGQGFDVHAFTEGSAVTLCGVTIPFDKSLAGHSDADVGLHALTDAILGGLGDGDIGTHFPPSDPQWKGADSVVFLEDAAQRVVARGGQIRHVDVTLICEEPKIGPHRAAMTERLVSLLGLAPDRISVKATTTERLGFPGRGEGIAALAMATLALPAS